MDLNITAIYNNLRTNEDETNAKMKPKEFAVNEFLTVKLVWRDTIIYVNGESFMSCKLLLINVPIDRIRDTDELDSIDEAADKLGWDEDGQIKIDGINYNLSPETEFWGHCSNLQVWYEHNYDTRLLHSNLAFSLLKKLAEGGDPQAKKVLKEEIAKRLESGYPPVVEYLVQEGYTRYLNSEELLFLVLVPEEAEILLEIESHLFEYDKKNFYLVDELDLHLAPCFTVKNKHVTGIYLFDCGLDSLPDSIGDLSYLESLDLTYNRLNLSKEMLKKLSDIKSFRW